MAKLIETNKKRRTAKQGWVTRLMKQCNDLIGSDQLTYDKLVILVESLKTKWSAFETAHDTLITHLLEADKDIDEFEDQQEKVEADYLKNLTKFESKLKELTTGTQSAGPPIELPKVTLPTITLPEFAGEVSEWPAFWDKFNGLIHQRRDIAKINKFSYLLGQLKSTALLVVSQLAITEDNYDIAIQLLKDNYEDKELITTKLVNKLLDLKPPNHNFEELQLFRITLNSTLESLKLNNDVNAAAWLLRIIIQNKLNKKTLDTLYYKYSKCYFSLQEIDETLLEICKTLCHDTQIKQQKTDSSAKVVTKERKKVAFERNKSPKYKSPIAGSSSVGLSKQQWSNDQINRSGLDIIGNYTTSVNKPPVHNNKASPTGTKPKSYRTCVFCSEHHDARICGQYKGSMQRIARLKELGRCTICLSSYHQGRECQTRLNKCPLCKEGIHHMLLCEAQTDGVKLSTSSGNNVPSCSAAVPVAEVQVQSKE